MTFAQKVYLSILCAENYPEQEPEYHNVRWYHLFYLLIPIVGFMIWIETMKGGLWNK